MNALLLFVITTCPAAAEGEWQEVPNSQTPWVETSSSEWAQATPVGWTKTNSSGWTTSSGWQPADEQPQQQSSPGFFSRMWGKIVHPLGKPQPGPMQQMPMQQDSGWVTMPSTGPPPLASTTTQPVAPSEPMRLVPVAVPSNDEPPRPMPRGDFK